MTDPILQAMRYGSGLTLIQQIILVIAAGVAAWIIGRMAWDSLNSWQYLKEDDKNDLQLLW